MLGNPQLLLLDEPTDGVDPVGRMELRQVIKRQRERGVTVFFNSHLLSEVEQVCDRVAIFRQGRCDGTTRPIGDWSLGKLREAAWAPA